MTNKLTLSLLACCAIATMAQAQSSLPYDKERLPDFVEPMKAFPPEPRLMKYVPVEGEPQSRRLARQAAYEALPDHWNNADTRYFPPIFNQSSGSCNYASRSAYAFTHEINALRDADGSLPENQYPTHWGWLLMNAGLSTTKCDIMRYVGTPNVVDYGGRTYSEFFGPQEPSHNDFGWMNGYARWRNTMNNRITSITSMPMTLESEAGRMAAKAWLYNHAGDLDFKAGGLIVVEVASGGNWQSIPRTAANDAIGATGKKYVYRWGTTIDHSLTIVGYDDRIEFDLDGNGKAGEVEKDEKGAWIIANSWGGEWQNEGFIYCPYKYAGYTSDPTTGQLTHGYMTGSLINVRKNYTPQRAIKLKMAYSHRSELQLQVGISTDPEATEPERVINMYHFKYAGDGNWGDTDPAPATPMLGRWQGTMNYSAMEFMYDLTDFSADFDQSKPLKYFFIINRKKDTNQGKGNILEASIVDMKRDPDGVESLFDLGGERFEISNEGKRLMISTLVHGEGYNSINNLALSDGVLTWTAPRICSYRVASYNVYSDDVLLGNTRELTYTVDGGRAYGVSAVYEDGYESERVTVVAATHHNDVAANIEEGGFTIPKVFDNHYTDCTIEFLVRPTRFADWNNQAGPGWNNYMQHSNADGTFCCGWSTGDRITSTEPLELNTWQHMAIVVEGNRMTLYKDAKAIGSCTSGTYSGIGGFGDFVFRHASESEWQNAQYDEIRIWDHARSVTQLQGSAEQLKRQEFYGDVLPQGLLAYYKGDTFMGANGGYYLREYVHGYHAPIHRLTSDPQVESTLELHTTSLPAMVAVNVPEGVQAGQPVVMTATRGDAINDLWWNIPACGIEDRHIIAPTVAFPAPGSYDVIVSGRDYSGQVYSDTVQVAVGEAPELDASFTINSKRFVCGEHLSMSANKFTDGCAYQWLLPGARVETVYGAKAGATYEAGGEYTITLRVTAEDGRTAESSQTIQMSAIAPEADFYVSEPIVMKGTPVTLTSSSRYMPTSYEWTVDGPAQKTIIREARPVQTWTPRHSGRYDVTLSVANAVGDNSITKGRAVMVLNAESGSGLFFTRSEAQVTIPNTNEIGAFTFDFWANASSLGGQCWGMGKDQGTMLLSVDGKGKMTLHIKGKAYSSPEGFVEIGVWNHYAISRSTLGSKGTITFMRNGETIATVTGATTAKIAAADMPAITLGVGGLPITGAIDEFRFWKGSQVSKMKTLCNQPMENPEAQTNLLVYYDCNQSGGDLIDRSGKGNDGVRTGFGPDGDAWGASKGVFSLYFGDKQEDEVITGIEEVLPSEPVAAGRTGVYTLSGQYVGRTIQGLPAGLYIVDGKKMVVR